MLRVQKLDVYQKTRLLNKAIFRFLKENPAINRYIRDQWTRAKLSIPLNIAEGSSRFAKKEKRHLYIIARSSAKECVAAIDANRLTKGICQRKSIWISRGSMIPSHGCCFG